MPLNTSIPLAGIGRQGSFLDDFGQAAQAADYLQQRDVRREQAQQAQVAGARRQQAESVLTKYTTPEGGVDWKLARPEMMRIEPKLAMEYDKYFGEADKEKLQTEKLLSENQELVQKVAKQRASEIGDLFYDINTKEPDWMNKYNVQRQIGKTIGYRDEFLPETPTPEYIESMKGFSTKGKGAADAFKNAKDISDMLNKIRPLGWSGRTPEGREVLDVVSSDKVLNLINKPKVTAQDLSLAMSYATASDDEGNPYYANYHSKLKEVANFLQINKDPYVPEQMVKDLKNAIIVTKNQSGESVNSNLKQMEMANRQLFTINPDAKSDFDAIVAEWNKSMGNNQKVSQGVPEYVRDPTTGKLVLKKAGGK